VGDHRAELAGVVCAAARSSRALWARVRLPLICSPYIDTSAVQSQCWTMHTDIAAAARR
jgi:hypothetical protein